MVRPALWCAVVAACVAGGVYAQQATQPPQQPQQPVFRAGVNFVQVDAYPTGPDGKIIEGLSTADFQILEDGKPQRIESSEFIRVDLNTPEAERRDPNTQEEGNRLAADPRNRVFIIFLDRYHGSLYGSYAMQRPLVDMLNRMLSPNDLFGVTTVYTRPRDLILGRQTETLEDQLAKNWTWGLASGAIDLEPEEQQIQRCYGDGMALSVAARTREERTLNAIDGMIDYLGALREARKVFIVFTKGWPRFKPEPGVAQSFLKQVDGLKPRVGVSTGGQLTMTPAVAPGMADWSYCSTELIRAYGLNNDQKFRDLIDHARRANVTFYPVNPNGLTGGSDMLRSLANETDGFTVFTNDMRDHLKRIADDVSAYYVLGYYSNAKPDGAFHKIEVKVTRPDARVKARRGYTSSLVSEGAAAPSGSRPGAPAGLTDAMGVLSRLRTSAELFLAGTVDPSGISVVAELAGSVAATGAWLDGSSIAVTASAAVGTVTEGKGRIEPGTRGALVRVPAPAGAGPYRIDVRVTSGRQELTERMDVAPRAPNDAMLGAPLLYRATPAASSPLRPVADMQFRRTERAHIEWPLLTPIDQRSARLLAKDGSPLPVPVTITERDRDGTPMLAADLTLAPLAVGDYIIEVTTGAGPRSEKGYVALRIRQ
jgi:VWFA-related protein